MEEGEGDSGGDSQPSAGSKDEEEKEDKPENGSSRIPMTQDPVRLKCRELIANALKAGGEKKVFSVSDSVCFSELSCVACQDFSLTCDFECR